MKFLGKIRENIWFGLDINKKQLSWQWLCLQMFQEDHIEQMGAVEDSSTTASYLCIGRY